MSCPPGDPHYPCGRSAARSNGTAPIVTDPRCRHHSSDILSPADPLPGYLRPNGCGNLEDAEQLRIFYMTSRQTPLRSLADLPSRYHNDIESTEPKN